MIALRFAERVVEWASMTHCSASSRSGFRQGSAGRPWGYSTVCTSPKYPRTARLYSTPYCTIRCLSVHVVLMHRRPEPATSIFKPSRQLDLTVAFQASPYKADYDIDTLCISRATTSGAPFYDGSVYD